MQLDSTKFMERKRLPDVNGGPADYSHAAH